jgi:hypothetical protein
MRRAFPSGILLMLMLLTVSVVRSAQWVERAGEVWYRSWDFFGSLLICVALAAVVWGLRWRRDKRRA